MSVNSIGGLNNFNYGCQSDGIKPETLNKLRALGIDENSVRTETQAQNKINQKVAELQQQMTERVQAEAASQHVQVTDISQFVQGLNSMPATIQPAGQMQQVDGLQPTQQIQQPQGLEAQNGVQNKQVPDDQTQAFAGSANQQVQQAKPFELSSEIIALQNKLKLGLAL